MEMYDTRQETPTEYGTSWYIDVCQYLEHETIHSHISIRYKRELCLKALAYQSVDGVLHRKHSNGVFLKCLEAHESKNVLQDLHDGPDRVTLRETPLCKNVMSAYFC